MAALFGAGAMIPVGRHFVILELRYVQGLNDIVDRDSDALFEPLDGESGSGGITVRLYRDNNNDGLVDLVTVNETDSTVTVLLSDGAGGFSGIASYATNGNEPRQVAIGDLTGDGFADRMYGTDLGGQIWRFDIRNGASPATLVTGGVIEGDRVVTSPVPNAVDGMAVEPLFREAQS